MVALLRYFRQCSGAFTRYISVAAAIERVCSNEARTIHARRICVFRQDIRPRIPCMRSALRSLPKRNYDIARSVLGEVRHRPFLSVHGQHDVFTFILRAYIRGCKRAESVYITYICLSAVARKLLIQRRHSLAVKYLAVRAVRVTLKQDIADVYRSARHIGSSKSKYVTNIIK